ncbi:unnamed protein product [Pedinophyceae sp. YPF-701]|nr:unnamed protein product [Pedinophyceae sp. YPF-701]
MTRAPHGWDDAAWRYFNAYVAVLDRETRGGPTSLDSGGEVVVMEPDWPGWREVARSSSVRNASPLAARDAVVACHSMWEKHVAPSQGRGTKRKAGDPGGVGAGRVSTDRGDSQASPFQLVSQLDYFGTNPELLAATQAPVPQSTGLLSQRGLQLATQQEWSQGLPAGTPPQLDAPREGSGAGPDANEPGADGDDPLPSDNHRSIVSADVGNVVQLMEDVARLRGHKCAPRWSAVDRALANKPKAFAPRAPTLAMLSQRFMTPGELADASPTPGGDGGGGGLGDAPARPRVDTGPKPPHEDFSIPAPPPRCNTAAPAAARPNERAIVHPLAQSPERATLPSAAATPPPAHPSSSHPPRPTRAASPAPPVVPAQASQRLPNGWYDSACFAVTPEQWRRACPAKPLAPLPARYRGDAEAVAAWKLTAHRKFGRPMHLPPLFEGARADTPDAASPAQLDARAQAGDTPAAGTPPVAASEDPGTDGPSIPPTQLDPIAEADAQDDVLGESALIDSEERCKVLEVLQDAPAGAIVSPSGPSVDFSDLAARMIGPMWDSVLLKNEKSAGPKPMMILKWPDGVTVRMSREVLMRRMELRSDAFEFLLSRMSQD